MKNIEKIKEMDELSLAEFLMKMNYGRGCEGCLASKECRNNIRDEEYTCLDLIIEWLNNEVNE